MKNFFTILTLLGYFTTAFTQKEISKQPQKRSSGKLRTEALNADKYKIDSTHIKTKDNYDAPQIFSQRAINDYDKKTGFRNSETYFYSSDGKTFTNYYRFLFTYYPNGYMKTITKEWWTPASNSWVGRYRSTESDYDINGNSETYEFEKWNYTTNVFEKDMLNKSKYNAARNQTMNKSYTWDGASQKYFLLSLDSLYSFDTKGNTLSLTTFEVSNTGSVTPTERTSQKFNASNQLLETLTETWSGTAWANKALHAYRYDANIRNEVVINSLWNATSSAWAIYDKDSIVYNAKNYYVKWEHQRWNATSNSYVNFSASNTTYDPSKDYLRSTDTYETWDIAKNAYSLTYLYTFFSSEILLGNSDAYLLKAFGFSPNPVSDNLSLSFSFEKNTDFQVNIINNMGQLMTNQKYQNIQENQATLSVANLPNGAYFLQIISDGKQATKQLVVNH
jgi:hypothetical protein